MTCLKFSLIEIAVLLALGCLSPIAATAEESRGMMSNETRSAGLAPHPSMREDTDGNLEPGEYEVISTNGSITRAACPYTCESRGLPRKSCKTWSSKREPEKCYVQDTRLPSEAVPLGK